MTIAPGSRLGQYEIVSLIGGGGMGLVYKAQDTRLKRLVALKLLPPELTRDETAKQRFLQEAQAASALDHPNICTIHEINETPDGQLYLVMAYYEGETLKEKVERGPLALDEAVDIAIQVGQGLAAAHTAGVVHRDIKPANVMLPKGAPVKIVDFGLAKLAGQVGLTQTGKALGTVAYMSPEQLRGQEVDHRADLWSLGVVLYEMLAARRPFPGEHAQSVVYAILNTEVPPLPSARAEVPADLARAVGRALTKLRGDRQGSAEELVTELRAVKRAWEGQATAELDGEKAVPSIAVLPFANMSADPEQEYFCEGLAEELIDALARLDGLRVVARTSAFQFRGRGHDLRQIGEKLKVKTVLEGSVRKAGNRLRINAQLINAEDGYHLWSERYDRQMEDVFTIQDEVSQAIVDVLRVKLLRTSTTPVAERHTEDVEAYQLYLQGRHHWQKHTEEGYARSLNCFTKAIARDARYAQPYVGLANLYLWTGFLGSSSASEAYPKAKEAALKALELDETIGDAHSALGFVLTQYEWDWAGAQAAFTRAIELAPHSIDTLQSYSVYLMNLGPIDEAVDLIKREIELDPLFAKAHQDLGYAYYVAGRFDEAEAQLRATIDLDPYFPTTYLVLGFVYVAQGRIDQAVATLERGADLAGGSPSYLATLAGAYARKGRTDTALEILRRLETGAPDQPAAPVFLSWVHIALGDTSAALDCLDRAYDERSAMMISLSSFQWWAPLRAEPRFQALVRRMNYPDTTPAASKA